MKIPISLTFKFFDEQITVKKKVDDMHVGETLDMLKNIMVPLFGEKVFEDAILSVADNIRKKRLPVPKNNHSNNTFYKFMKEVFEEEVYL